MKKSSSNAYQAPAVLQWLDIELEEPILTTSVKTGGQDKGEDPGSGDIW